MNTKQALEIVQKTLENPVHTWLEFTPQNVPIVLYDDDEFVFINHPNPPKERPEYLTAATAIEINGLLTATIPLSIGVDEQSLIPMVYHECFHVYQAQKFQFDGDYNFFEVLAFYPELNPAYRALCSAETDVLNNNDLSPLEKAKILSGLTRKRHDILSPHDGLLDFEIDLERKEGVASFVEQKARLGLFNIGTNHPTCNYGYSRQYFIGAATCWLLDQIVPSEEWQALVEGGKSLSELLLQFAPQEADLSTLKLENRESAEKQRAAQVIAEANHKIERLFQNSAITIKLPQKASVFRAFSPQSVVSLGDGRLIHPEFVIIQIPNGKISIQGMMALENYQEGTVSFPAKRHEKICNRLDIHTENVQVSLEKVKLLPNGVIEAL
jgi:hypothetical protein